MSELFLHLVNISIKANYIIIAIILIRLLFKKMPKWILCMMWLLVGIRLVFPFSIQSIFSLIPSSTVITTIPSKPIITTGIQNIDVPVNHMISSTYYEGVTVEVGYFDSLLSIITIIWIIGMMIMLCYTIYSYYRIYHKVKASIQYSENVYLCDDIDTPFILGMIRPKIYIPSYLSQTQIYYVLQHELAHIRRKDHFYKPISFIILTIYWFNPLLWLSYIMLCKDIEAACDEFVVKDMVNQEKKLYLETLFVCSVQRPLVMACPLAFGEVDVKTRTKNIIKYKKPTFIISILSILLCIIVGISLLTDPKHQRIVDINNPVTYITLLDDVESIKYVSDSYTMTIPNQTTVDYIVDELMKIEISSKERSKARLEKEDAGHTIGIIKENNMTYIHISHDYTYLWLDDNVKPTYTYKVYNIDKLKNICDKLYIDVDNHIQDKGYYDDLYINDLLYSMTSDDNNYVVESKDGLVKVKVYNGDKGNKWIYDYYNVQALDLSIKPVEDESLVSDGGSSSYTIYTFKVSEFPTVIRLKNVTESQLQDYTFDQAISQNNITIKVLEEKQGNDLYEYIVNELSKYSNSLTDKDLDDLGPDLDLQPIGNYEKSNVAVFVSVEPHKLKSYVLNVYNREMNKDINIYIDVKDYKHVEEILEKNLVSLNFEERDFSKEKPINNKEAFKNKTYVNYNINNIIKELNIKDVKILVESDMRLVFNFQCDDPKKIDDYCRNLSKNDFVYNMGAGTITSGYQVVNHKYKMTIIEIADGFMEEWKDNVKEDIEYSRDVEYNVIVEIEER